MAAFDGRGVGQKPILAEDGRRELLEDLPIRFADVLDGEQPVRQPVLAAVGVGEAHVHELIGRAHHQEVGERQLLIAGDEDESVRARVEIEIIVVTECEEAVGVRDQRLDGHETQELIHVEVRGDLLLEPLVVALLDQAGELDEALGLGGRRLRLRLVLALVFLPVIAEEVDAAEPLRLQEQALVGVEAMRRGTPDRRARRACTGRGTPCRTGRAR